MGSTLGEQLNSQGYAMSSLGAWRRDGLTLIAFSTPTALAWGPAPQVSAAFRRPAAGCASLSSAIGQGKGEASAAPAVQGLIDP